MLETIRAWLNGTREYYTGVVLYSKMGSDTSLLNLLKKGETPYTADRLLQEMLSICNELKSQKNDPANPVQSPVGVPDNEPTGNQCAPREGNVHRELHHNPELYVACKALADKTYKEVMNLRAELFALARADDYTDPNTPDKIKAREKLAVIVVLGFQKVSLLYNRADYVKKHGRLPDQNDEQEENDYDALPDHLVKGALDNLRKNVNKMKKREQTPERLALIQKHQSNIQKLETRWRLLKPALQTMPQ